MNANLAPIAAMSRLKNGQSSRLRGASHPSSDTPPLTTIRLTSSRGFFGRDRGCCCRRDHLRATGFSKPTTLRFERARKSRVIWAHTAATRSCKVISAEDAAIDLYATLYEHFVCARSQIANIRSANPPLRRSAFQAAKRFSPMSSILIPELDYCQPRRRISTCSACQCCKRFLLANVRPLLRRPSRQGARGITR